MLFYVNLLIKKNLKYHVRSVPKSLNYDLNGFKYEKNASTAIHKHETD